jgi:uncharacterized repeat protein (TIGR03833 family)
MSVYPELKTMSGQNRNQLSPGTDVSVVQKHHQRSGELTRGIIDRLLTKSASHPHGIKVRLTSGVVGRVKVIHD